MKVTRDVVIDLWPVYESGDASGDTRALVEEFLRDDPEFARAIQGGEIAMNQVLSSVPVMPHPDTERATLARIQKLFRLRFYFLALATTLMAFTTVLRQYRAFTFVLATASAVIAAVLWLAGENARLATLVVGPAVETEREAWFRRGRTACITIAFAATLLSGMVARKPRVPVLAVAIAAIVGWIGLVVVGRFRRG